MRRSSVLCTHKMPACLYAPLLLAACCKAKLLSDYANVIRNVLNGRVAVKMPFLRKRNRGERDGSMPNNTGTGLNISHNMSYGVMNLNVKCLNHHQCTEEIGKEG